MFSEARHTSRGQRKRLAQKTKFEPHTKKMGPHKKKFGVTIKMNEAARSCSEVFLGKLRPMTLAASSMKRLPPRTTAAWPCSSKGKLPPSRKSSTSSVLTRLSKRKMSPFIKQNLMSKQFSMAILKSESLISVIGKKSQTMTCHSFKRSFGVGLLVGSIDQAGTHLFETCPSGN